jgi:type VI secretion system ImpA family protein
MVDLDELLSPISPESPAGENLRYSDIYHIISEARREDEQSGSQGIWTSDAKQADWNEVIQLSARALSTRTKDLQLACWLADALYQDRGLTGLAEGLGIITALCERFWDCLYPEAEPDDLEARLAPLLAMEKRLVRCLAQLPLTEPDRETGGCYALQHWIAAERLEVLSTSNQRAYKKALSNGEVPIERIRDTAARTPVAFYQGLLNRQQLCAAAVSELESLLDVICGAEAPSFSALLGMLAKIERMIGVFAGERMPQPSIPPSSTKPSIADGTLEAPQATEEAKPFSGGAISSRQHAYQLLEQAAEYLLSSEPHSPVPYLVRRAIRWGNMPLGSLIAELVDEDQRTQRILNLLNIAP